MANLFTKKSAELTFVVVTILIFALYGQSNGQCLQTQVQKSRCQNMKNELSKTEIDTKALKTCLEDECVKMLGSLKEKDCTDPPAKVIPGFNTLRINKTLTVKLFLEDVAKRIAIHIAHNKDIRQHFKSVKCSKNTKLVRNQLNKLKLWIRKTRSALGFSDVVQSTLPPRLATIASKNWYAIRIQMLKNLGMDVVDMTGYFKTPKTCIIPAC